MYLSYALDMSLFRVEVKREKAFITSERKKKLKENNKKKCVTWQQGLLYASLSFMLEIS